MPNHSLQRTGRRSVAELRLDSSFRFHRRFSLLIPLKPPNLAVKPIRRLAWMHWYQDWYQVGFPPLRSKNKNPRKPLCLQGLKLEAGVRIELTIGVLQAMGNRADPFDADWAS